MEFSSERTFPATPDSVTRAVAWARDATGPAELPPRRALHLELAVEEAVANIVHHGFPGRSGELRMRVGGGVGRVRLEIEDDGIPFDPLQADGEGTAGPSGERTAGGLGIVLLKRVAERLAYGRDAGRNHLVFEVTSGG